MDITLKPELERYIREKVDRGVFDSWSDAVNCALTMWRQQEELSETEIDELRREVMRGVEQARRGLSTPLDMQAIKAEVRRRRAERKTA